MLLKEHSRDLRLAADDWDEDWKSLIATALSARTRDEKTIEVCNKLFSKYNSAEKLGKASLIDVEKIIKPVNYYKTKSKNIIKCAGIIAKKHSGNPPVNFSKLIELPGVGRKTANVFLSGMGRNTIGVDTHVAQISKKLGWTKNKKPELIEKDIKELFPRRLWRKINETLVRFGRSHRGRKQDEILKYIFENRKAFIPDILQTNNASRGKRAGKKNSK